MKCLFKQQKRKLRAFKVFSKIRRAEIVKKEKEVLRVRC